jgi:hypothetical protein
MITMDTIKLGDIERRQSRVPSPGTLFGVVTIVVVLIGGTACVPAQVRTPRASPPQLSASDEQFLEDLSRRTFAFFWEQADPKTGIVRDRSTTDGGPANENARNIGSIASVGFGLSGLCIAAERGWQPRAAAIDRAETTLRWFAESMPHERGWFYHFVQIDTGARAWQSELSSIDSALLLAGVLTVKQCFADDPEVVRYADAIYRRVDFQWMLAGDRSVLAHGWRPESGFLRSRWDHYCELMILYVLAIGSPSHPIPAAAWRAWTRPIMRFQDFTYVSGPDPLFVHQYSHAWIDFRGRRDFGRDWFENSAIATRAHRAFCIGLSAEFPGYSEHVWGITASDSRKGYVAWGGPPRHPAIDGTVVPAAAAGSLMLTPDIALPALRDMHRRFGGRFHGLYGRYGFADAFHPTDGWVNPDVIGIDLGITLLSAENLRTGRVWRWFMANPEIPAALDRAGVVRSQARQLIPVPLMQRNTSKQMEHDR